MQRKMIIRKPYDLTYQANLVEIKSAQRDEAAAYSDEYFKYYCWDGSN